MKRILLFGDSIFNGYRQGRDTDLVTKGLAKRLGPNFKVDNISRTGGTTFEALALLEKVPKDLDLIILEYGTNDASTGWGISLENYRQNLQTLVNRLLPAELIIVGPSAPEPGNAEINQFYGEKRLQQYNQIAQNCAQAHHLPFLNLLALFGHLPDPNSYYQADGQHLTDKGNDLLLNALAPLVRKSLKELKS